MPTRKRANVTDGTEHSAHVLVTELVRCEFDPDSRVIFKTAKSKDYSRSDVMTLPYARKLYAALGKALAESGEDTGLIVEDVTLEEGDGNIWRFTIKGASGEVVAKGIVTAAGARAAETELRKMFGRGTVSMLELHRR